MTDRARELARKSFEKFGKKGFGITSTGKSDWDIAMEWYVTGWMAALAESAAPTPTGTLQANPIQPIEIPSETIMEQYLREELRITNVHLLSTRRELRELLAARRKDWEAGRDATKQAAIDAMDDLLEKCPKVDGVATVTFIGLLKEKVDALAYPASEASKDE